MTVRTPADSDPEHSDGTPSGTKVLPLAQHPIRELPLATRERKPKKKKRRKKKEKATDSPPKETDNDKCRRHKEIQKFVKMMNGRLLFLEHCIKSEKEFPDLTDDDALVGYQKVYDEPSSLKEGRGTRWSRYRIMVGMSRVRAQCHKRPAV
ncbi:hypothetical protein TNCV_5109421 [Trichonephila clavipes]|nr:hypothetical protein TNCV_5109421 [Trichonephila clavipes]